jgi:hypothetical protein
LHGELQCISFGLQHKDIAAHIFSISNTMIDATPPPPSRRPLGNVDTNRLNQYCTLHKRMLCIHCHEACKSCEPTTGCIGCEASRSASPNKGGRPKKKRRGRHSRSIQRNLSSQASSQASDATVDSQLEMVVNENHPASPLRENFNLGQLSPMQEAAVAGDETEMAGTNETSRPSTSSKKRGRPKKKRGRYSRSIQRNLSSQSSSQTSDATMDSQLEMIVNENQPPVSPLRENFNLSQPPPAAIEIDDETVMVANERPTATTAQLRENSIISHSQSILAVEGAVEEDNENEDMEDGERRVEQSSVLQETQNEQIEQAAEIEQSLTECIDLLHQGMVPSTKFEESSEIKKQQRAFLKKINYENGGAGSNIMIHCSKCKERWLDTKRGPRIREPVNGYICKRCNAPQTRGMYDVNNDMDPFPCFDHLKLPKLSEIEERMVCKVQPYMKIFRLQGTFYYFQYIYLRCGGNTADLSLFPT